MSFFHKISDGIDFVTRNVISILLAWMTIVMTIQVASRHLLSQSLTGTEEMAKYTMIWMVFLAAAVGTKDNSQMKVTILEEKFPKIKKWLIPIQHIFTLVYLVIMIWLGIKILTVAAAQNSPNMGVSMAIIYFIFPLACSIMLVHIIPKIFKKNKKDV